MGDVPGMTSSHDGSRRRLTVGLLMCVVAIAFEAMAVLTAMPAAAADLGDLDLYAWAFTAFVLAQTFSTVAAGGLSDRFGPVPPLVAGFVVFTGGLVLAALAPTMAVLLLARFVQGLGGGTVNLAVMVLVARVFDERERADLMTGFSAAWMGPAFLGPPIAAWLAGTWSWHWVFWSVLPLLAVAAMLMAGPLRRVDLSPQEPVPAKKRHLGLAALVAVGAALLQWAGQRIEPLSVAWVVIGAGLLVVGLPPLMPRGFSWFGRGLAAVVAVRTLTSGAFFGAQTFLPLMLVQAHGLSLFWAGATMTIGSVGWMLGSWLQSRPWLRMRRDAIIAWGAAATFAGLVGVAINGWLPSAWLGIGMAGWVAAGVGMGLSSASTSLAVMQLSDHAELGRNSSALQVGEALGNSISAGLAGTLFVLAGTSGQEGLFAGPFTAMAAIACAAVGASRRIGAVENHSVSL